ncbi:MAG: ATP-binding cassette domain-containing protein [Methanospirillaceae archaeon]|nr:ATP-binding cassette domain-containing protein [Methanospirillaceae archaeon]
MDYKKRERDRPCKTPIVTHDLTRYYGDLCAVNRLNLEVENEIFGILGPNGSGKTTTVMMLTTLLAPTSGTAEICGYDIHRQPELVRKMISYVPQDMAVDVRLTGRENVMMYAELYGITDPAQGTRSALKTLDLADRADDFVKTYSGGMRRRLELAQALVHNPQVLFLDEPTVGLDVAARKKIWHHIRYLRETGMSIFVTTHYMDEADRYCDRVAIIDKGIVKAIDTPDRLKSLISHDIVTATISGIYSGFAIPGVTYAESRGDELVFFAQNGEKALPQILDALAVQGLSILAMSIRRPSLDDVFLHLTASSDEDAGPFNLSTFRNILGRRG